MSSDMVVAEENSAPTTPNILDPVDIDAVVAFFDNYQELTEKLLEESDYQQAGFNKDGSPRSFKKKSAFRKYSTAFNLSDSVVEKEIIRDDEYHIISARYEVQVIAPNGRSVVGTGSSSIFDKIRNTDTVEPSAFELRKRFSNAEHDILSTAHTRAKNRAIGDLIGAGEVSAEEMEGVEFDSSNGKPSRRRKNNVASDESVPDRPSAPKRSRKPKKVQPEEDDDVPVVVEAEVVKNDETSSNFKSIKELADENPAIRKVVSKMRDENSSINKNTVSDELLVAMERGVITTDEYYEAKELLEQ